MVCTKQEVSPGHLKKAWELSRKDYGAARCGILLEADRQAKPGNMGSPMNLCFATNMVNRTGGLYKKYIK